MNQPVVTNMTDIVNAQSERAEHALLEGTTEEYAFFDDGGQVVPILEWSFVAIAVMILLCLIHKNNRSRSNMDASRHPNVVEIERERRKEEAKRKKTIIKLFQTEHIQQKITGDQIKSDSCKTLETHASAELDANESDLSYDEEEGYGTVVICPFPRVNSKAVLSSMEKSNDKDNTKVEKSVTNMCAICLEEYQEGETIVWSSNKNCSHAFHRDCLTNYLVKVKAQDTYPCPCCRQNFFFDEKNNEMTEEV